MTVTPEFPAEFNADISVPAPFFVSVSHPVRAATPPLRRLSTVVALCAALCAAAPAAWADKAAAIDEMEAYLEFVDYGGGVMFAQQIPKADWPRFMVIDARDAAQYAKEHIPGAVNMDWRQVLAKRNTIPKDKPVLLYCNTGTLSAQAGFALRVAGWDNVRVLQGGLVEWKASGGFDAATQATGAATH
jgi:rhodanese-related sulfurtransferase